MGTLCITRQRYSTLLGVTSAHMNIYTKYKLQAQWLLMTNKCWNRQNQVAKNCYLLKMLGCSSNQECEGIYQEQLWNYPWRKGNHRNALICPLITDNCCNYPRVKIFQNCDQQNSKTLFEVNFLYLLGQNHHIES